jgi:hypothetical protein
LDTRTSAAGESPWQLPPSLYMQNLIVHYSGHGGKISLRDLSSLEMEHSGCSVMLDQESMIDNENFKFASMCSRHCMQILYSP